MIISYQKPEIIKQAKGKVGLYRHIERCARVCYKSEDKITDDSYKRIVDMLLTNGHLSCIEHGTVYLTIPAYLHDQDYASNEERKQANDLINFYINNPYSRVYIKLNTAYVTTNLRVLVENNILEESLKFMDDRPTEFHAIRVTVHFISDISVNRSLNRHRLNSVSEESTIYCNYARAKFGKELTISKPVWLSDEDISKACDKIVGKSGSYEYNYLKIARALDRGHDLDYKWSPVQYWLSANIMAEFFYMRLIALGWSSKQARTVLPLDTKSELVHTAFIDEWLNLFYWRGQEDHPQTVDIIKQLQALFVKEELAAPNIVYSPSKLVKK